MPDSPASSTEYQLGRLFERTNNLDAKIVEIERLRAIREGETNASIAQLGSEMRLRGQETTKALESLTVSFTDRMNKSDETYQKALDKQTETLQPLVQNKLVSDGIAAAMEKRGLSRLNFWLLLAAIATFGAFLTGSVFAIANVAVRDWLGLSSPVSITSPTPLPVIQHSGGHGQ